MSKVYCPEILDDLPTSPRSEYLQEISETNFKKSGEDDERLSSHDGEKEQEDESHALIEAKTNKRHSIANL